MTEQELMPRDDRENAFAIQTFEHAQRVAKMLASSDLIPKAYQGRVDNVMIAMEIANRMSISPLMVMQNLYIVKGMPGWSGKFVIASINGSKRFSKDLDFEQTGTDDNYGYSAFTFDKDGNKKTGTKVDWKMVKAEGWLNKDGSKWKTMPEQMFKYRAAAFFGNAFCPDLLMGMQTAEEIQDSVSIEPYIDIVDLQNLLDDKVALLTKSEFDDAKRIIGDREVTSYKKLYKFLNDKEE